MIKIGKEVPYAYHLIGRNHVKSGFKHGRVINFDEKTVCLYAGNDGIVFMSVKEIQKIINEEKNSVI